MLRDLEPLATSAGAYVFAVLLGLLWGSFANVCIYRWPPTDEFPKGRSVVLPGSHCFVCKTPIRWYDNTPLLSWLWLRGKCRSCQAPFSPRYLFVEALTGALFGVAWWATIELGALSEPFDQRLLRFAVYAAFGFVMVVIAFIDLDHKLILDKITLPAIVVFYALGLVLGRTWHHGLVGAVIGYVLPWSVGEIYWLLAGREGLGLGDSKLLAVIGALLGAKGVVASLFGGAMVGAVIGVAMLLRASTSSEPTSSSPAPSRWGGVLAIAAVASVVVATFGALTDRLAVGLVGSVLAIGALVLARRLEPVAEEAASSASSASSDTPDAPAPVVGGKALAARLLALVAGGLILLGVTSTLMAWLPGGLGGGVTGVGLLLLARKLGGADVVVAGEAEPAPPEDAAPSLLRTELPFGPFLAMAAVFYLFAEPWIVMNFRLPGG